MCSTVCERVFVSYAVQATFNANEKQRISAIPNSRKKAQLNVWPWETDFIFFVLNRNKRLCPVYTIWMWKTICFLARKNCAIICYYPGTSLFNTKVIDNKIHLSLASFLVFIHHFVIFVFVVRSML